MRACTNYARYLSAPHTRPIGQTMCKATKMCKAYQRNGAHCGVSKVHVARDLQASCLCIARMLAAESHDKSVMYVTPGRMFPDDVAGTLADVMYAARPVIRRKPSVLRNNANEFILQSK